MPVYAKCNAIGTIAREQRDGTTTCPTCGNAVLVESGRIAAHGARVINPWADAPKTHGRYAQVTA